MSVLKSFVGSIKEGNLPNLMHKRRAEKVHVPTGDLEDALEPQRQLVAAVRDIVLESARSFDALRKAQHAFMRAAQGFLGFDTDGMDESAIALLQGFSTYFQASDDALNRNGLMDVVASCDRFLREFESVAALLRDRDEAHREFEHYNEKVAGMLATPEKMVSKSERDRFDRNQEKLGQAQRVADDRRKLCDAAVRTIVERRQFHARASLHAAMRCYTATVAAIGQSASPVAQAFREELQPGTIVEVIGFPEESGLNGYVGVVSAMVKEGHYSIVSATEPDGTGRAVRAEHLVPLGLQDIDDAGDAEGTPGAHNAPSATALQLTPASGPTSGGIEAVVALQAAAARAVAVADVFVGGQRAEILGIPEGGSGGVRVRLPPSAAPGPAAVEIRLEGWQRYIVSERRCFMYYEPLSFGQCGCNIVVSSPLAAPCPGGAPSAAKGAPPTTAVRTEGLVYGIAVTAQPIPELAAAEEAEGSAPKRLRYFEVVVAEISEQKTTKALSIGYVWPLTVTEVGRLPESASLLMRGLVVGGDLPKAHFAGKEIGKVTGWRPILDVVVGSTVGAALEAGPEGDVSLVVYQDGARRFSTSVALPQEWASLAPHGVVDVAGNVRKVELRQGAVPPPPAAPQAQQLSPSGKGHGGAGDAADQPPPGDAASRTPTSSGPPGAHCAAFNPPTRTA